MSTRKKWHDRIRHLLSLDAIKLHQKMPDHHHHPYHTRARGRRKKTTYTEAPRPPSTRTDDVIDMDIDVFVEASSGIETPSPATAAEVPSTAEALATVETPATAVASATTDSIDTSKGDPRLPAGTSAATSVAEKPTIPPSGPLAKRVRAAMAKREKTLALRARAIEQFAAGLDGLLPPLIKALPGIAEDFRSGILDLLMAVNSGKTPAYDHPGPTGSTPTGTAAAADTVVAPTRHRDPVPPHATAYPAQRRPRSYAAAVAAPAPTATERDHQAASAMNVRQAPRPNADHRIMVRLPAEHPLRQESSFATRGRVTAILGNPDLVRDVHKTVSGVAIVTAGGAKASAVLKHAEEIKTKLGATNVERQEHWEKIVVRPVPHTVHTPMGPVPVTEEMISNEIKLQTGLTPRRVAWARGSSGFAGLSPTGEVGVHLSPADLQRWRWKLRLFGDPVSAYAVRKKPSIQQCERCFGPHHIRNCARTQRCGTCAAPAHPGACSRPVRCVNCRGPHAATDSSCPMWPKRKDGVIVRITKSQRLAIRAAGGQEWAEKNASERRNAPSSAEPRNTTPPSTTPPSAASHPAAPPLVASSLAESPRSAVSPPISSQ